MHHLVQVEPAAEEGSTVHDLRGAGERTTNELTNASPVDEAIPMHFSMTDEGLNVVNQRVSCALNVLSKLPMGCTRNFKRR